MNPMQPVTAPWTLKAFTNPQGFPVHYVDYGNGLNRPASVEDIQMGEYVKQLERDRFELSEQLKAAVTESKRPQVAREPEFVRTPKNR